MTLVGAHISAEQPLQAAAELGADCIQVFLSNPQGWKKPAPRDDAAELKAAPVAIYVHAPYLINVCSPNNRIRVPSRKNLTDACEAAAAVGAAGVIVHAGHAEDGIEQGIGRWRRTLEMLDLPVPLLIENTAGGNNAVARRFDALAKLWEAIGDLDVGFCFDTCHAHAAGEDLSDAVERALKIVGRIDLLHVNDSRDPPGTGADRHENIGEGHIDPDALRHMIRVSNAPAIVVETPRDTEALKADIAFVRDALKS